MDKTTACKDCKFHVIDKQSIRSRGVDMWYDHSCAAPGAKKPDEFDPITGTMRKAELPHCNKVNKGSCLHYLRK